MLSIVVILSAKQKQEYGGIIRQLSNYLKRIAISEVKMDQELLTYILQTWFIRVLICFRSVKLRTKIRTLLKIYKACVL
jgi:hypothetical protein